MLVSTYMKRTNMTWHAFALHVGIAYATALHLRDAGSCSLATAKKIEKATGGKVSAVECLGLGSKKDTPKPKKVAGRKAPQKRRAT